MRHKEEWYTCDRCGVNIESKFVYTLLKEDIEKNAQNVQTHKQAQKYCMAEDNQTQNDDRSR